MKGQAYNSFVKVGGDILPLSEIAFIDGKDIESLVIQIHLKSGSVLQARDIEAIDIVMQCKPSLIEGKKLRFAKHAWIVHNFIGHPVMQLLAFFKMYKWAFYVHEVTIPRPKGVKLGV